MTEKQDMGVVTQADIDAAQGYIDAFNRDGINSKHKLAQHFADHRLASQVDQGEVVRAIEARIAEHPLPRNDEEQQYVWGLEFALAALATHPQPTQKGEGDE